MGMRQAVFARPISLGLPSFRKRSSFGMTHYLCMEHRRAMSCIFLRLWMSVGCDPPTGRK